MSLRQWLLLLLTCLVGIAALFVTANSPDSPGYVIGLLVFIAAVVYGIIQVKQYFDRLDAGRR
jgi:hypothetical protein